MNKNQQNKTCRYAHTHCYTESVELAALCDLLHMRLDTGRFCPWNQDCFSIIYNSGKCKIYVATLLFQHHLYSPITVNQLPRERFVHVFRSFLLKLELAWRQQWFNELIKPVDAVIDNYY